MGGRRAASAQLMRDGPTLTPPTRQILAFDDGEARPRILRVQLAARISGASDAAQERSAYAIGTAGMLDQVEGGQPSPWYGGAAMILRCGGAVGVRRTLVADLRSGEYALPPCESVELSVRYYETDDDAIAPVPLDIQAEVADGTLPDATPLQLTAARFVSWVGDPAPGGIARCPVPQGAWGWDLLPGSLPVMYGLCGDVKATRTDGGTWTPPTTPLILGGADCRDVRIWTDAPQVGEGWLASVIFYLR